MSSNTWGKLFRVTIFGESHGKLVGMVIDGCPAGIKIDISKIQLELNRRRPGQSKYTTARNESDVPHIVSGLFEEKTTGAPITGFIYNQDQRSKDYDHLSSAFRPSHADFTYETKYGHRDYRGGGRSSARETAARVMAGALAKQILEQMGIEIYAYVSQVGTISVEKNYTKLDLSKTESNPVRCPDLKIAKAMMKEIEAVKKKGDTLGGIVSAVIKGCPVGLGAPVFDKLHADLGKAMLSINAVKGFEYGSGFAGVTQKGSEHNDLFVATNAKENKTNDKSIRVETMTNHSGGIQGGISNGMDIYFRVAFKPVATILQSQKSINLSGKEVIIQGKGRHDPCVVPRAVPIVEAMAAIVILDHVLLNLSSSFDSLKKQMGIK